MASVSTNHRKSRESSNVARSPDDSPLRYAIAVLARPRSDCRTSTYADAAAMNPTSDRVTPGAVSATKLHQ
jgi:hypothetical protein